jgi:hypothetical protein
MSLIKISGKNLAQLNDPNCCHRCFQTLTGTSHRRPFSIFPGIFSTFDAMQKKHIREYLDRHGNLPAWMKLFADGTKPADTPHTLQYHDKETDILLVGIPDEVLVRNDKSLMLLDYKTARHTDKQDALLPLYQAQVNAYAWMLGKCDLGDVTLAGLVYFEPTGIRAGTADECFSMGWKMTEVPVDLDPKLTPKLLNLCRTISDMTEPAEQKEGCWDCGVLESMLAIYQSKFALKDAYLRYMTPQERVINFAQARRDYFRAIDALKRPSPVGALPSRPSLISEWDRA